jgi:hypothetical protein
MRGMRVAWLAAGLVWAAAGGAWADQTNYVAVNSGAPEMRVPLGARALGQGGAFTAEAEGAAALAWNPAGLGRTAQSQLEGMHTFYLQDTTLEQLSFAQPLGARGGLGVQAVYVNYGTLDRTEVVDGVPQTTGTFNPGTWLLSLGYGHKLLPAIAVGVAGKYYRNDIAGNRYTTYAGDAGVQWEAIEDGLKLGAAVQNVGNAVAGYSLPLTVRVGGELVVALSFFENDHWTLSADYDGSRQGTNQAAAHLGTEYQVGVLSLRAGYTARDTGNAGGASGLALGAGVAGEHTYLDYAALFYGALGTAHQISFGVLF